MTYERWEVAQRERQYEMMLLNASKRWCWACGRGERDVPPGWYGPFLIERAHIARKPRARDTRVVVLLCSCCHRTSHGDRIILNGNRWPLPKLEVEHLLWLKFNRDRDQYDRPFIQSKTVRILPNMIAPPKVYLDEYERRRGGVIVSCS